MIDAPETIGTRLRTAREKRGMTRKQLAAQTAYSERSIRRWEDEGYDSLQAVNAVCRALEIHPAQVLFCQDAESGGRVIAAWLPDACVEAIERLAEQIKSQK